jgi:hypothetical protein
VSSPAPPGNKANKAFEKIAKEFQVNGKGEATYAGLSFMTSAGPCTSSIIGNIS